MGILAYLSRVIEREWNYITAQFYLYDARRLTELQSTEGGKDGLSSLHAVGLTPEIIRLTEIAQWRLDRAHSLGLKVFKISPLELEFVV